MALSDAGRRLDFCNSETQAHIIPSLAVNLEDLEKHHGLFLFLTVSFSFALKPCRIRFY